MEFFDDDGTSGVVVKGNPSKLKFAYLFFHQTAPMKTSGIIVRGVLNIFGCGWGPRKVYGQETTCRKHVPDLLAHCSQFLNVRFH